MKNLVEVITQKLNIEGRVVNYNYVNAAKYIAPLLTACYGSITGFYSPISHLFLPLIALGLLDVITGIMASKKEKIPFKSGRLWIRKALITLIFLMGLTAVLLVELFLKEFGESLSGWAAKSWMLFYASYELVSILENLHRIYSLPFIAAFLNLFKSKLPEEIKAEMAKRKEEGKEKP